MTDDLKYNGFNAAELLKLAAKATKNNIFWNETYCRYELVPPGSTQTPESRKPWNPMQDDGDALRLAVKLRLSIKHGVCIFDDKKQPSAYVYFNNIGECVFEPHGDDPRAATRLAIVRAAAHIGARQQ